MSSALSALWSAQTLKLRAALGEELVRCADELGDPALRERAANLETHVCVEQEKLTRAQAAVERAERMATDLGHPTWIWVARVNAAAL